MSTEYSIWNPTENITALVETPVSIDRQPEIAARIMAENSAVEQVGFVTDYNLRMAGGEFCGNATMSAAARLCLLQDATCGETQTVSLGVSGADHSLCVTVTRKNANEFFCTVEMPCPKEIITVNLSFEGKNYRLPMVRFGGVDHIIVEQTMTKTAAQSAICQWCSQLSSEGLGLIFLDRLKNSLTPLVYIPAAQTLVWESSCASGTTAAGVMLYHESGESVRHSFKEPGGILTIEVGKDYRKLTGTVKLVKKDIL